MNKPMENYKERLAKLTRQLMASRFLCWWLGELSSMVPGRMKRDANSVDDYTLVDFNQTEVVLRSLEAGKIREVCRLPLNLSDPDGQRKAFLDGLDRVYAGRRDVALALPSSRILRKTLTLPLATEENLRQVLEFQMEQYTPFTPAQIFFAYRVVGRDFERNQLKVEFVVTPRDSVDEAVKTLAGWGASVRAVVADDMLAKGNVLNMFPSVQSKVSYSLWRGVNPWLAGLVLFLILAVLIMPLVIKREAVLQLNPWVEKGKKAAEATDVLRRQLESKVEEHNYLLDKKRTFPPVISVLDELSRVLPDDTWVQQLDVKGKELQIQGETASSSRLISLFEQSAMFHDASFKSPLIKGQGAGTEHYHLALEIRPLPMQPAQPLPPAPVASTPPVSAKVEQPAATPSAPDAQVQSTVATDAKQPAPATEKKP